MTDDIQDFNQTVIADFRANGGKVSMLPFPTLLLTHTGARSGKTYTSPLAYGVEGDAVYIIASKAGAPTDPAWMHNLRANPEVTVEVGDRRFDATARETEPEERDRLFAAIAAEHPQFHEYTEKTDRKFPVVVLDGVTAPA